MLIYEVIEMMCCLNEKKRLKDVKNIKENMGSRSLPGGKSCMNDDRN